MDFEQIKALDKKFYMNTFGDRIELIFESGEGCTLYTKNGDAYTDFLAGIATNALGYNHKGLNDAIICQLNKVVHTSNYFYNQPQAMAAQALCEKSGADRVFFASTGAEANEGAIKLARINFNKKGSNRYEIISCNNSFHGRTLATLAATGQKKYQDPFLPMPQGFINVPYGDIDAIKLAITDKTAAIMLEVIQGEGGIIEGGAEYLEAIRQLCNQEGILMILDEVQTGMGRTGSLFAHQMYGVEPDIFTAAKALGNGLPISAVLCKEGCAAFSPTDHGTTLGGNALCCAGALYIINTITGEGFLQNVTDNGNYFKQKLIDLQAKHASIKDVRGVGLMLGVEFIKELPVINVVKKLREKMFIVGTAGNNTLRLVPPLIITKQDINRLIGALDNVLMEEN